MSLYDLNDYKLETEFHSEFTQHTSYRADRAKGIRKQAVIEKWATCKPDLGAGSFGIVRLETCIDGHVTKHGTYRAVKQLSKLQLKRSNVDYKKELMALTKFSRSKFTESQAFVEFFGWFENEENISIAMEHFPLGTLDRYINEELRERDARVISQQILDGLNIMHQEGFTHRDLKPQNIFIVQNSTTHWWIKIGDFGITKRVSNNDTALQTATGTPYYLAPEVNHYWDDLDSETDVYTNAVDIWSLGCVVYEMLALQVPFPVYPRGIKAFCRDGLFPSGPLHPRTSEYGIQFVQSLLIPNPITRPLVGDVLTAEWLHREEPGDLESHSVSKQDAYSQLTSESYGTSTAIRRPARMSQMVEKYVAEENLAQLASLSLTPKRRSFRPKDKAIIDAHSSKTKLKSSSVIKHQPRQNTRETKTVKARKSNHNLRKEVEDMENEESEPSRTLDDEINTESGETAQPISKSIQAADAGLAGRVSVTPTHQLPSVWLFPFQGDGVITTSYWFHHYEVRILPTGKEVINIRHITDCNTPEPLSPHTTPSSADIRFELRFAEFYFCELWCVNERWFVRDKGSYLSTFLNGRRLSGKSIRSEAFEIRNWDKLLLGGTPFGNTAEQDLTIIILLNQWWPTGPPLHLFPQDLKTDLSSYIQKRRREEAEPAALGRQ